MSLLYSLDMMYLMRRGFNLDGITFVPVSACLYTNRLELTLSTVTGGASGSPEMAEYPMVLPFTEGQRLLSIELCGKKLFWDAPDACLRYLPEGDLGEPIEPAPGIRLYPGGPVCIARAFAEESLSPDALTYAYRSDDQFYYWNWLDGSVFPVVFELAALFCRFDFLPEEHPLRASGESTALALGFHAPSYVKKLGIPTEELTNALLEKMKHLV